MRAAMAGPVRHFAEQLIGIRHGVVSPGLIDTVRVEIDGQKVPVKQLAWVTCDGNRIVIQAHDPRESLAAIDNALKQAGFNSYVFSMTRGGVGVTPLGGEEREKVKKQIARLAEEARTSARNVRKRLRQRRAKPALTAIDPPLQKLTDEMIAEIG